MMSLTRAFTLIAFGFFTRFVRAETPALCETDWCMNQVNRRVLEDYSLVDFGAGPHRRLDLGGITVLDFEGVGDNVAILDYYQSEGVIFSSNALAIVDRDVGGSGNFANEPSPDTIMFFLSGGDVVVNVPGGFTTGFSFFYSSVQSANVDVYSEVNKGGTKLATLSLVSNWRNDGCVGDPTGNFCHWDPIGVSFTGVAKSIDFAGAANRVGFDDITFGSVEPRNGGVIDDPHFKTWAGKWYDFMGACDLHLINAPNFADESGRMLVDIRTKIRHEYSYIESAVLQIGEETLEVSSFGDYILNGVDGADLGLGISDLPIIYSHPSKHVYLFEVTVDGEEKIVLKVFKDMVSVKFENADSKRFHGSSGMMGDFETGELLARDGATIISDPNEFAAEWQVRHDEPMLFQSVSGPQHPQACELPDPTRTGRRRLGESIALEAAEKACAHWDEDTRDICVHDVIATGDLELASGGSF